MYFFSWALAEKLKHPLDDNHPNAGADFEENKEPADKLINIPKQGKGREERKEEVDEEEKSPIVSKKIKKN